MLYLSVPCTAVAVPLPGISADMAGFLAFVVRVPEGDEGLVAGEVLVTLVLFPDTLSGEDPLPVVLTAVVRLAVVLPDEAWALELEEEPVSEALLLTVLLLPPPPRIDELPLYTRSAPVCALEPYHTSLLWSGLWCPGPGP